MPEQTDRLGSSPQGRLGIQDGACPEEAVAGARRHHRVDHGGGRLAGPFGAGFPLGSESGAAGEPG